ncbi:MAG TPA: hypothetical protein VGI82_02010 [Chitinophagaceae bacterium]
MRQSFIALLLLAIISLSSCKKNSPDIQAKTKQMGRNNNSR